MQCVESNNRIKLLNRFPATHVHPLQNHLDKEAALQSNAELKFEIRKKKNDCISCQ